MGSFLKFLSMLIWVFVSTFFRTSHLNFSNPYLVSPKLDLHRKRLELFLSLQDIKHSIYCFDKNNGIKSKENATK